MQLFFHFTDIDGGVSKTPFESLNLAYHVNDNPLSVKQNHDIISKKFGIKNIVIMNQVHKTDVKVVKDNKIVPTSDSIVTNVKNLALIVLVADCIPLLLYDRKNRSIAAVHAGRAGVFGEIAKKTVKTMKENFGSNSDKIVAYLGPCIHQCCYRVSSDVLEYSKKRYPKYVKNSYLDIKGILINQLKNLNIYVKDFSMCSCCNQKYFSYRRDGVTGRNAGIIMLKDINA